jgi:hypothetical protein
MPRVIAVAGQPAGGGHECRDRGGQQRPPRRREKAECAPPPNDRPAGVATQAPRDEQRHHQRADGERRSHRDQFLADGGKRAEQRHEHRKDGELSCRTAPRCHSEHGRTGQDKQIRTA